MQVCIHDSNNECTCGSCMCTKDNNHHESWNVLKNYLPVDLICHQKLMSSKLVKARTCMHREGEITKYTNEFLTLYHYSTQCH